MKTPPGACPRDLAWSQGKAIHPSPVGASISTRLCNGPHHSRNPPPPAKTVIVCNDPFPVAREGR